MTARKNAETETPATETPDESARPAEVEGKCNAHMTTAEGALDRCHLKDGHKSDHVSWTSYQRVIAKGKTERAAFAAWREEHDPSLKAKREALAAKKLATLQALAAELGYTLTKTEA